MKSNSCNRYGKKKKQTVAYLSKDEERSKNGIIRFKWEKIEIESTSVKKYLNTFYILSELSKSERLFLDFIVEEMDDSNIITNDIHTRTKFNELLKKVGSKTYSNSTIQKCFSSLSKIDIIYAVKGKRGIFQINPAFFFYGTEEARKKAIRKKLEEVNIDAINNHRHRFLSKKYRH